MGVTIHYKGTINNLKNIDDLCDEVIDIAKTMGWPWMRLDEDLSKPCTATTQFDGKTIKITGHLPLKGVSFHPHKACEHVDLYFDAQGRLNDPLGMILQHEGKIEERHRYLSVKTQFAPIETHITIVKLLRHLKKRYIPDLEVRDEGGYWETNDAKELQRRIDSINEAMDILQKGLATLKVSNRSALSAEEIADRIEEMLKKQFRARKSRRRK